MCHTPDVMRVNSAAVLAVAPSGTIVPQHPRLVLAGAVERPSRTDRVLLAAGKIVPGGGTEPAGLPAPPVRLGQGRFFSILSVSSA